MTIFTVHFNYKDRTEFDELLRVFRNSVRDKMPGAQFVVSKIQAPPKVENRSHTFSSNSAKLYEWVRYMEETDEGHIIFADCDMLLLRDASHAFNEPFDVAVTMRPTGKYPMNGGIVFARNTDKARAFFRLWAEVNDSLFRNPEEHQKWRAKYAGMNQAAFGYMLEQTDMAGAHVHQYSTMPWNAVDSDWPYIDSTTVFLHVKSMLRREVMRRRVPYGKYKKAMQLWYNAAGVEPIGPSKPEPHTHRIHHKKRRRHHR